MPEPKHILRLSTPAELIGSIPYLIGFQPEASLVAVGLRPYGTKSRSMLTMRSDLPGRASIWRFAKYVIGHLAHQRATAAIFVLYSDSGEPEYDDELLAALARQAGLQMIDVHDALVIRGGRWRSVLCGNHRCCPPEGTPIGDTPGVGELTAVVAGLTAAPSRQALADSIKPVSEIALAAMAQQVDVAAEAALTLLASADGHDRVRDQSMELIMTLLDRHAPAQPIKPTHTEAARVLVGLRDLLLRDECMRWTRGRRGDAALALWTDLTRLSPPPMGAPPATLLAYAWWQRGDGAMANVALERALAHDPDYTMAKLLVEALQRGVRPEQFSVTRLLGPDPSRSRKPAGSRH